MTRSRPSSWSTQPSGTWLAITVATNSPPTSRHSTATSLPAAAVVCPSRDPVKVLPDLARQVAADLVHWNTDVSPYAAARRRSESALQNRCVGHPGSWVHPPGSIQTSSDKTYRVFTHFPSRLGPTGPSALGDAWRARVLGDQGDGLPPADGDPLMPPRRPVCTGWRNSWIGSIASTAGGTIPTRPPVSQPISSSGRSIPPPGGGGWRSTAGRRAFLRQLAWRDFYGHLMAAYPWTAREEMRPEVGSIPWRTDPEALEAWKTGTTGYPMVDAGMRQLLAEGWMPNRVRMVVASFLVKDLLIDWREEGVTSGGFWSTATRRRTWGTGNGWRGLAPARRRTSASSTRSPRAEDSTTRAGTSSGGSRSYDGSRHRGARTLGSPRRCPRGSRVRLGSEYPKPIVDHPEALARRWRRTKRLERAGPRREWWPRQSGRRPPRPANTSPTYQLHRWRSQPIRLRPGRWPPPVGTRPSEDDRYAGAGSAAGASDRRGEVLPIVGNHYPDSNRLEPIDPVDGGLERGQWDICAQFDRLEPGAEEYIAHHGDAEAVPVVWGHRQYDRTARPPAVRKPWTQPPNQPGRWR